MSSNRHEQLLAHSGAEDLEHSIGGGGQKLVLFPMGVGVRAESLVWLPRREVCLLVADVPRKLAPLEGCVAEGLGV